MSYEALNGMGEIVRGHGGHVFNPSLPAHYRARSRLLGLGTMDISQVSSFYLLPATIVFLGAFAAIKLCDYLKRAR